MRRVSLFAALVVAMTAVSCVKEMNVETPENPVESPVTFEATFGAVSKAVLEAGSEESKVAWEAADQVSVLVGEGNYLYAAETAGYTTTLKTDAANVPVEGDYYAVYPYDEDAILEGKVITTSLPATQAAVLNSFSSHLSVSQAVENTFSFRNVCGLVRVNVASDNVTKVTFAGNNNENVAGSIRVTVSGEPTWEAVEGAKTLELVPAGDATELERGDYYLAVLPQTFVNGITVTAYKGENAWDVRKTSTALTIERSDMKNSNPFGVVGSGTEEDPYLLDSALDLVEMRNLATVGGETWFKMIKDVDLKGFNWEPVNYDENFERQIHFDGNNRTISNLTCSTSEYADGSGNYPSLFGVLYGTCKNLKIDNANITCKRNTAAGVIGGYVGTNSKPALVENVMITNSTVESVNYRIGGVAGITREGTFNNVSYQGKVKCTLETGAARAGGFVGQTMEEILCTDCTVDAIVDADGLSIVGGFVGYVNDGGLTVESSSVAGRVTGDSSVGGFVAEQAASATINISESSCSATVTAGNFSGGFLGRMNGEVSLSDCSVSGSVTVGSSASAIVGWLAKTSSATLENCSVTGTLKGNNNVGGIVGLVEDGASNEFVMDKCSYKGETFVVAGTSAGLIGYLNGQWTITNSDVETDITATGGNVGGLVGSVVAATENTTSLTMSNCTYKGKLTASAGAYIGGALARINATTKSASISDVYVVGTVAGKQYVGGFIGAAMCSNEQSISNSGSTATVSGAATKVGGFAGAVTNPLTLTGCYATGNVTNSAQGTGGLIGSLNSSLTVTDSYATGDVTGTIHTAGIIGEANGSGSTVMIARCYSTGNIKGSGNRAAGILAGVDNVKICTIENCYSTGNVSNTGQQNGGIVAYVASNAFGLSITNCFATGDIGTGRGCAGVLGNSQLPAGTTSVTGCIAWNEKITTSSRSTSNYAPAAVVGSCYEAGTFKNCIRRSDMVLTDAANASKLTNQENVENALLPLPNGITGDPNRSYHGKAAAADATISSVAKTLGWDETVWDLSGAVPVLK